MAKTPKYRIQVQYRDSDGGGFVTEDYAKRHPKTTERQHIRHPVKPPKKPGK